MVKVEEITIAQDGQNSSSIKADRRSIIRLRFPTMTSTAATLQESEDDENWSTLGGESGNLGIANPSGRSVQLNLQYSIGVKFFRVVVNNAEAEERTVSVVTEDYTT
jgi:hypothetical protein